MAATDFKDYYAILGIGKTASADEVKQAFRRLARKYHPDVNPGDKVAEAKFKEINEAHEVLSDPDKRKKYDQFGQYWKQAGTGGWPPGAGMGAESNNFDFNQYANFDEFINELLGRFNNGPASTGNRRTYNYRTPPNGAGFDDYTTGFGNSRTAGQDLESSLTLTLAEAFAGTQKRINLGTETITVKIPAGAKQGSRIRIKGKGQPSLYGGPRGDLYLAIELQPHPFFQLDGENLTCEVPIAPDEAVLGAAVEVPTPDGTVTVNIPAGVKSGQTLRLRSKGWQLPKGGRGDQLVKIVIVPPPNLSPIERECYEKLRDNRSSDPRNSIKTVKL